MTMKSNRIDPKPAILGGPSLRDRPFPEWPVPQPWMMEQLQKVLESRQWGIGSPVIDEFEKKFAEFVGTTYAGSCVNGTEAITVALRAAGITQGDEVITSPYTFIGTITPVLALGAIPRFVDISPENYLMDVNLIEKQINEHTRAIIPVHIAGCPVDMEAVIHIADKHKLVVIEDCAQAHGAEWKGKRVGSWGHLATWSFQTSKNMSSGEGGAVTTSDPALAVGVYAAKNCGRVPDGLWYAHERFGSNLRLSAFQAALLIPQIDLVDQENDLRHRNALYLDQLLKDFHGIRALAVNPPHVTRHAHHLVLFEYDSDAFHGLSRNHFVRACQAEGVPVGNGYVPLYTQGCLCEFCGWKHIQPILAERGIDYRSVNCPITDKVCGQSGFWIHQSVLMGTEADMESIVDCFLKIQKHSSLLSQELT